jgi:UDP-N-acetylmuramoyl-tripeptide--D-alanyl-D-alanine ligase
VTIPFRLADAARWTGGEIVSGAPDALLGGVTTDSRSVPPGALFVAIRGPRHDGHDHAAAAVAAGAAGLLLERGRALPAGAPPGLAVVQAEDTTLALGRLAAGHRGGFRGPVVAITGSNGKTTTKEMCAAILSVRAPCLKNPGNLNNQYGLPLSLLAREECHHFVVVEIGMNHRGEIAPLAAIARPTVGVLTNVGTAHIEHLGSREEIAREKGDLIAALPDAAEGGWAVLNADDERVMSQAPRTRARLLRFGLAPGADVRADSVRSLAERGFAFDLRARGEGRAVHVEGLGRATVSNALAAAAAALAAGASLDDVSEGLARYRPVGGRMERVALPRNIILINDTYNANPQSLEIALRSLTELRSGGRAVAVLGDMGELGESAAEAHREAGRRVAELGIDYLFALGRWADETAAAAARAGMAAERIHVGKDHADTAAAVRHVLQGNDWVLVKGSRSMRMERVVELLAHGEAA